MEELFHKPAKKDWQSQLRRAGVLNAEKLSECSELRAFSPSRELASKISHYWILRWNLPDGETWKPIEVLSAPVVTIFFMKSGSFIQGIAPSTLEYEARNNDVIAGLTFLPGGFFPYWKRGMNTLPEGRIKLDAVFPRFSAEVCEGMLSGMDDTSIATAIDDVFLKIPVENNLHQKTILEIVSRIESDPLLSTVASVSEAFKIPERTLQHMFRTEVGTSIKWLLMRARLLQAATESLGVGRPDWSAIAYRSGYSSQAHFITDFKLVFGVSPDRYRKITAGQ
jgi:AraC-like DNA-binding protein